MSECMICTHCATVLNTVSTRVLSVRVDSQKVSGCGRAAEIMEDTDAHEPIALMDNVPAWFTIAIPSFDMDGTDQPINELSSEQTAVNYTEADLLRIESLPMISSTNEQHVFFTVKLPLEQYDEPYYEGCLWSSELGLMFIKKQCPGCGQTVGLHAVAAISLSSIKHVGICFFDPNGSARIQLNDMTYFDLSK